MFQLNYSDLVHIPCPLCGSKEFSVVTVRQDSSRIVQCASCNHVYLNPTIPDQILQNVYNDLYYMPEGKETLLDTLNSWFADPDSIYQYAVRFINKNSGFCGKAVLDIGCGPGRFLYECRKFGASVCGVDISATAAILAKKYFNLDIFTKEYSQAIKDGFLASCTFDYIFAFEVIEHLRNPLEFIHTANQLLSSDGLIFISTPNFGLFDLMGRSANVASSWEEHLHFFRPKFIAQLLESNNFQVVDINTVKKLPFGERKKRIIGSNNFIAQIWRTVKGNRFVYTLKNRIFRAIDRLPEPKYTQFLSGQNIICIAKKHKTTKR